METLRASHQDILNLHVSHPIVVCLLLENKIHSRHSRPSSACVAHIRFTHRPLPMTILKRLSHFWRLYQTEKDELSRLMSVVSLNWMRQVVTTNQPGVWHCEQCTSQHAAVAEHVAPPSHGCVKLWCDADEKQHDCARYGLVSLTYFFSWGIYRVDGVCASWFLSCVTMSLAAPS